MVFHQLSGGNNGKANINSYAEHLLPIEVSNAVELAIEILLTYQ